MGMLDHAPRETGGVQPDVSSRMLLDALQT